MKIKSITIQAFRGFCDKVTFNLQDANVLLLYGPNGHGKTSVYDAIEWALTGEIYRFSTANDERRRTRFIRNLHADSKKRTYVTLEVIINSNFVAKVTRICTVGTKDNTDYGKHSLQVFFTEEEKELIYKDDEAERLLRSWLVNDPWENKVEDPSRILGLTHILSQEKLNEFVRGMKDGERYNSLSTLFGTEHFLKYKDLFKHLQDSLKEKLQVKIGQIKEVDTSIKNIEVKIDEVSKKIDNNGNVSLEEILLPYINMFDNVKDLYEKKKWNKVKQIILKNQDQLSIERYQLESDLQVLLDIPRLLDKWEK
ncbi:AAA family ATPase, partial [Peribacillus sp. NPDC060186]